MYPAWSSEDQTFTFFELSSCATIKTNFTFTLRNLWVKHYVAQCASEPSPLWFHAGKTVSFPSRFTCSNCLCKHLHYKLSWLVCQSQIHAGSHLMTFPTYWGWQAISAVLWVPLCKTYFPPAGHHFSPFHPPRSGNENDVPLERGKNSPPWRVRGATRRANCLDEIPVRDEWAVKGLLVSQACAAAGLCPVQSLKATIPCFFSVVCVKIWKVLNGDSDLDVWFSQRMCSDTSFLMGVSVSYCLPTSSFRHLQYFLTWLIR